MDISIRDWMIIIGVLLIVAVLLDGYRRMRGGSKRVRVSLTPLPPEDGRDDLLMRGELPNGGARVIERNTSTDRDEDPPLLTETADDAAGEVEPVEDDPPQPGENLDLLEGIAAANPARATELNEVLMLHVVAQDEAGFSGNDILQVLAEGEDDRDCAGRFPGSAHP